MLLKPDVNVSRISELADLIEQSTDYNQNDIHHCICGMACKTWASFYESVPTVKRGAELLGIKRELADQLFAPKDTTPQRTARVLRHLAVTGEVNWMV